MTEWSEHVKRYAKKHKMSYRQASMSAKCKESYRKKKKRMSPRKMKMPPRAGGGARGGNLSRREEERAERILESRRIGIEENPCLEKGRYKCSKCEGNEDPILLSKIKKNKGLCADKQCYDSDNLRSWLITKSELPLNRENMTVEELDTILEGMDKCRSITKKYFKGTSKEEKEMFLLKACESGDSKSVKLLLGYRLDINNITNEFGSTPLILAVISGSTETVDLLLSRGADPNKETPAGDTALFFAISNDVPEEISELLLNAGVDPNKEIHEMTPITSALLVRKIDIIRNLLDHGAYPNRNSSRNRMNTYEILEAERQEAERQLDELTSYYPMPEHEMRLEEDIRILEEIREMLP